MGQPQSQQLKHGLRPTPPSRTNRRKHAKPRVEIKRKKETRVNR